MATTQYIIDLGVVDGTSNVSYLLSDQAQEALRSFTPRKVEECFGPGDARLTEDSYNKSKGYADPEWYWVSSKRQVWGIGWRWGCLLYTSPSPRDRQKSRMPSSA